MSNSNALQLDAFQDWAVTLFGSHRNDAPVDIGDLRHLAISALGLNGEAGEASEHVKKYIRGDGADLTRNSEFGVELGDTLFYLAVLARQGGYKLSEIAGLLESKLYGRRLAAGRWTPGLGNPSTPMDEELSNAMRHIDDAAYDCNLDWDDNKVADLDVQFDTRDPEELATRYARLLAAADILAREVRNERG